MTLPKKYRQSLLLIGLGVVLIAAFLVWSKGRPGDNSTDTGQSTTDTGQQTNAALDDPNNTSVIVNKLRPLPDGYAPTDLIAPHVPLRLDNTEPEMQLRQEAALATEALFNAAKADGYNLLLTSAYRSQTQQASLYNYYIAQKGQVAADTDSARPRYSEHQTGLAVDVGRADRWCEVQPCFAETPEGKWLAANAVHYGFIIRYLPDKEAVTGYVYEPWHLRYIGKDLADKVNTSGQTLEEFFGLPAAAHY